MAIPLRAGYGRGVVSSRAPDQVAGDRSRRVPPVAGCRAPGINVAVPPGWDTLRAELKVPGEFPPEVLREPSRCDPTFRWSTAPTSRS